MGSGHPNTRKPAGGQAGFTLLEVLLAIFLLTVGLLGMAALTTGIIQANNQSKDLSIAVALAQEALEKKSGEILNTPKSKCPTTDQEFVETFSEYPGHKRVTIVDYDSPDTAADNMYRITVQVFWRNGERSVQMENIIKKPAGKV
ncbi:MAG: prepilin-type N-terminal cleavage/methylation domain-containing protein [Deltaproteobacteria bacterium]|nr:prepilin-type N-terminal cleavage/methylation domain-containing protein [Deltaproteobacteria bacterium]